MAGKKSPYEELAEALTEGVNVNPLNPALKAIANEIGRELPLFESSGKDFDKIVRQIRDFDPNKATQNNIADLQKAIDDVQKIVDGAKQGKEQISPQQIEKIKKAVKKAKEHAKKAAPIGSGTFLEKLEIEARSRNLEPRSKKSLEWFIKQAKGMSNPRSKVLSQEQSGTPGSIIGAMYLYRYDPKHKKTLPYYDNYPLGFVVGPAKGGFYLLNLHYISPRPRAALFDALLKIAGSEKLTKRSKLQLSYGLLKHASSTILFVPCFKHYLNSHVMGQAVKIPAPLWEAALFLPIASWQKASEAEVWYDSGF